MKPWEEEWWADGNDVWLVNEYDDVDKNDDDALVANADGERAHLIAAAPDLYRALEAFMSDEPTSAAQWLEIESQCRAALKKARGETEPNPLLDVDTIDEGPIRTVSGKKARGET